MNRLFKIGLLMALVIGLFGAYRYVSAQQGQAELWRGSTHAPTFNVDIPNVLAPHHVLQATYINSGFFGGAVISANTFTPIDTQLTVLCPGTSGTCSINADMLVQNGNATVGSNNNRVCLYVDGVPGPHCDYFTDETTTDAFYINAVQSDIVSGLAHGNHTVQMFFWSAFGAGVSHFQATYTVYKP
jgi:hypothetical protein